MLKYGRIWLLSWRSLLERNHNRTTGTHGVEKSVTGDNNPQERHPRIGGTGWGLAIFSRDWARDATIYFSLGAKVSPFQTGFHPNFRAPFEGDEVP